VQWVDAEYLEIENGSANAGYRSSSAFEARRKVSMWCELFPMMLVPFFAWVCCLSAGALHDPLVEYDQHRLQFRILFTCGTHQ
jgi:hypothetical protein